MYQIVRRKQISTFDISNSNLKYREYALGKNPEFAEEYGNIILNKEHPDYLTLISQNKVYRNHYRNAIIDALAYADRDVAIKNIEYAQEKDWISDCIHSISLGDIRKLCVGDLTISDVILLGHCNNGNNLYWIYSCVESFLELMLAKTDMHRIITEWMCEMGDFDKICIGNDERFDLQKLLKWELKHIKSNKVLVLKAYNDELQSNIDVIIDFSPW